MFLASSFMEMITNILWIWWNLMVLPTTPRFSDEDCKELIELQKRHGNQWTVIGGLMGRKPHNVKVKWRSLTKPTRRKWITIMKTPTCRTSRESMGYKTPQTTLTLSLWPWPATFDLWSWHQWPWPTTFYLNLWPWTLTLTLVAMTSDNNLSDPRLKTGIFTFLTFVTFTFNLWPWPSNFLRYGDR